MGDDITIDTGQMKQIASALQTDTTNLANQTATYMGQLDDAYLNFPPGAANLAQESQISLNAIFKRVRTEDTRISEILQSIATAVEEMEKELVKAFTPGHK